MYVRKNNSTVILPVVCSMFDWGRPVILSVSNIIHRIIYSVFPSQLYTYAALYSTTLSLYNYTLMFKFHAGRQPAATTLHCTSVQCQERIYTISCSR